ncbi:hypothetical protein D3C80_2088190 [compost metagenome]
MISAEKTPAFIAWMEKRRSWLIERGKLPKHHQIDPLDGFPENVVPIDRSRIQKT